MTKKQVLILVTGFVLILAGYGIWSRLNFRVTALNPPAENFAVISPYLDITFSQKLANTKNIRISSNPSVVSGSLVEGKRLRLVLTGLQKDKLYIININNLSSVSGKEILSYTIKFTARDIAFANLPKGQQKNILDAQQSSKKQLNDPILSHLPYGGLNFSLEASFKDSKLVLVARILLSASDVKSDEQAAIALYESQVQDYIRSIGLNPSKYTIDYQVVEPSLY